MLLSIAIIALFLAVLMSATWVVSVKIHNAGIVDIVWAASFALVALLGFLLVEGHRWRRSIFLIMVTLWCWRLASHLFSRVKSHHPTEDGRYAALRVRWGNRANWNMFTFFQMQGLLILILSFPFLFILSNPSPLLQPVEWIGLAIWALAFGGESLADHQLKVFKASPTNKGQVCQVGLWRYSRHPNYFFEWLIWVSLATYALGSPWGWVDWYAPLLMLFFLLRVTGIPMTEAQAIKTKGDAYRQYQRTTPSPFVPWFPKSGNA